MIRRVTSAFVVTVNTGVGRKKARQGYRVYSNPLPALGRTRGNERYRCSYKFTWSNLSNPGTTCEILPLHLGGLDRGRLVAHRHSFASRIRLSVSMRETVGETEQAFLTLALPLVEELWKWGRISGVSPSISRTPRVARKAENPRETGVWRNGWESEVDRDVGPVGYIGKRRFTKRSHTR